MKYSELEFGDHYRHGGKIYRRNPRAESEPMLDAEHEVELVERRTGTLVRFGDLVLGQRLTIDRRPGMVFEKASREVAVNVENGKALIVGESEKVLTFGAEDSPLVAVDYVIPGEVSVALAHRDAKHVAPLVAELHEAAVASLYGHGVVGMSLVELAGLARLSGELIEYVGKLEARLRAYERAEEHTKRADACIIAARRALLTAREELKP